MRYVLVISVLLGCETRQLVEPERSASSRSASTAQTDWYSPCNEEAECVVVDAYCGEFDVVRRAAASVARNQYMLRNIAADCGDASLSYPRARCVAQRCVAEVDPTETPRDREARRHAVEDDEAVANLRSSDVLKLNFALGHLGNKPELGKLHVSEVSVTASSKQPHSLARGEPGRAQSTDGGLSPMVPSKKVELVKLSSSPASSEGLKVRSAAVRTRMTS
jgi:hypothetical protein